jgi:hypothetical protein
MEGDTVDAAEPGDLGDVARRALEQLAQSPGDGPADGAKRSRV